MTLKDCISERCESSDICTSLVDRAGSHEYKRSGTRVLRPVLQPYSVLYCTTAAVPRRLWLIFARTRACTAFPPPYPPRTPPRFIATNDLDRLLQKGTRRPGISSPPPPLQSQSAESDPSPADPDRHFSQVARLTKRGASSRPDRGRRRRRLRTRTHARRRAHADSSMHSLSLSLSIAAPSSAPPAPVTLLRGRVHVGGRGRA